MRQRRLRLFGLYLLVSLATRLVALTPDILNADEASYAVGAWELLKGKIPYTAFVDNKPPLVYAFYAVAQLIGGHGVLPVRLLAMLVMIPLTAFGVSAFYRHDRRGIAGALAFLVISASYDASNMLAVNCELLMMAPLVWAAVWMRDRPSARDAVVAGLLVGVAILFKYHAVFWLPALAFPDMLRWRVTRRRAITLPGALALGTLIPLATMAALFAAVGGFSGFWYWNISHNLGYVMNPTTVGQALAIGASRVGRFVLVTAVLWCGAIRTLRGESDRRTRDLVAALIVMSALACLPGWRFFPHYFIVLYAPLAIAAAPWLVTLADRPRVTTRVAMAFVVLWFVVFAVQNVWETVLHTRPGNAVSHDLAARLRADECFATGSMFVWGSAPTLYYHAGLPIGSRYFFPEFPLVRYYAGNRSATAHASRGLVRESRVTHWRTLMGDLRRNTPTYIVDTADAGMSMWEYFPMRDYPLLDRYVARHYSALDVVDGMRIYRLNGCHDSTLLASAGSPVN